MTRSNALLIVSGLILMGGSFFLPRGGVSPAPARGSGTAGDAAVVAEGRLMACPDALATVRSEYAGAIERYPAREHERVKKGALLASLRATDVEAQLAEAKASLSVDQARKALAENEFRRAERLWKKRATSFAAYDSARKTLAMAKARAERGEADVRLTEAILAKTRILSPIEGMVVARYHNLGEYVKVGSRIATVADLSKTRVETEVDEFDVGRVRIGQPAVLHAEGMEKAYSGVVVAISERVTRKHLIPEDPSRPTDTGVVRVKIVSAVPLPFKLGQKVDVRIDTTRTVPLPGDSATTRCGGS